MLSTLIGNVEPVRSVVFSPNGDQIVSGSSDHTVRVWDVASSKMSSMWRHDVDPEDDNLEPVPTSVEFSPTGDYVTPMGEGE
jgi:WD40 repeat protein